jgi:hypothetical protein
VLRLTWRARLAATQRHPDRAEKLSNRPLHRRVHCPCAWSRVAPRGRRRDLRAARRARRGTGTYARQLSRWPEARDGRRQSRGARRGGTCRVGPFAFGRRRAGRPERQRQRRRGCRFCRGLRLQVFKWRAGRTRVRVGAPATHRNDGCTAPRPATLRLAWPRGAVRFRGGLSTRQRNRPFPVRHPANPLPGRA